MYKKTALIILSSLLLISISACSQSNPQAEITSSASENPSITSAADEVSEKTEAANQQTTVSEDDPKEKVLGVYGETEIPDIPCGNADFEGKASLSKNGEQLKQCLDSMIFETHSVGDYKISLVGDSVRTDKENFPDSIYAQNLRIEVEKNGKAIDGYADRSGFYCDTFTYVTQYTTEYRLFASKMGSYLDLYELDNPVIAMRYFYDDDSDRAVKKAVEFATIHNDKLCTGFVGVSESGTGAILNPAFDVGNPNTMLILNSEDNASCRISIFAADEFNALDSKTLTDEEAGIKYTFDFSDPQKMELYTTEKI